MCNACGFRCCAYDGFSDCGCEWCPVSACHPADDDDGGDYDDYDDALYALPRALGFRCVEIDPASATASRRREAKADATRRPRP